MQDFRTALKSLPGHKFAVNIPLTEEPELTEEEKREILDRDFAEFGSGYPSFVQPIDFNNPEEVRAAQREMEQGLRNFQHGSSQEE